MKHELKNSPRKFSASGIEISDYGKVQLSADEMISVVSEDDREIDVTAKDWGFYLAPSLNGRLARQGYKVALVVNQQKKLFLNAVAVDKIDAFKKYLQTNQDSSIVCWLDEFFNNDDTPVTE